MDSEITTTPPKSKWQIYGAMGGRKSAFTRERAEAVFRCLAEEGMSLREASKRAGVSLGQLHEWMDGVGTTEEEAAWVAEHYARAQRAHADHLASQSTQIADDDSRDWWERTKRDGTTERVPNPVPATRDRLRIAARQWFASKLNPAAYGERTTVDHQGTVAHVHGISASGPAATRLAAMLAPKRVVNEAQQRDEGASDATDADAASRDDATSV